MQVLPNCRRFRTASYPIPSSPARMKPYSSTTMYPSRPLRNVVAAHRELLDALAKDNKDTAV